MSNRMQRLVICSCLMCLNLFISDLVLAQRRRAERLEKIYNLASKEVVKINVEIDAAEVRLRRSNSPKEARLKVHFDRHEFEVYENYDEARSRLDIEFDKQDWIDSNDDDIDAEFALELPADVSIILRAKIKAGAIDIDLGGLSIVDLDLTTWAGEVRFAFSKPNKIEMDHLKINTKIGETEIVRLGNARFKEAEINGSIGEMTVDFRGEILFSSAAQVDLGIGETTLSLPDDRVGVKLHVSKFLFLSEIDVPRYLRKSGRHYYSRNYDEAQKTLDLRVSPGLGELRIND